MSVETARAAWRDWLKSERRLAHHTLVAYEHDVATFLGFMTDYLGGPPTLAALGKLKPAEFRAWLAERARQGLARTSTARAFSSVRSFFQFLDRRGLAHNASIGAIQTKLALVLPVPRQARAGPQRQHRRHPDAQAAALGAQGALRTRHGGPPGGAGRAGARGLARSARRRRPAAALRRGAAHRRGARPLQGRRRGSAEDRPRHALRHRQGQQDAPGAAAAAGAGGACAPIAMPVPGWRPAVRARPSSSAPAAARSIPPSCKSACATSGAGSASPRA